MTTKNHLDLTDYQASKTLQGFLDSNIAFMVLVFHPDGYLVNAFSARLEKQKDKNAVRWHAYKRVSGKLKKAYIGRSEDVTIDRLKAIAKYFV